MAAAWNTFKRALRSATNTAKRAVVSTVDTTKTTAGSAVDIARAALGSAVDITKETVTAYLAFLASVAKWSLLVAVALLPLPIVGSVFHWSWMNGLYLLVLALICITLLMAASPLVMLAQLGYEHIKPYRKMAQLRAGIAFWALLIVMYFWLVPVWNYPAAIPLVLIICAFLAVGFVRFGIGLNPRVAVRVILVLLIVITVCFYMPASRSAAGAFVAWLDARVAGFLASPSHPASKAPRRVGYDLSSIDTIVFFDPTTSEPRIWYCESEDGAIELFDGPGYHPRHRQQLKPIAPDVVAKIMRQLKADAQQRMTQEEQIRARPHPPQRIPCDYSSVGAIVFFDPTTSQPRVWYYAADDGIIELFDGPGYHPQYKGELKPITPGVVTQISTQLKADAEKAAQEAQRRREELERIAKEQRTNPSDGQQGARYSKTARAAKPPLIKAEDTEGQVAKQKDRVIRSQDRAIQPEDANGTVVGPKNR